MMRLNDDSPVDPVVVGQVIIASTLVDESRQEESKSVKDRKEDAPIGAVMDAEAGVRRGFTRSVMLGRDADFSSDAYTCVVKDGVLRLSVPRHAPSARRELTVRSDPPPPQEVHTPASGHLVVGSIAPIAGAAADPPAATASDPAVVGPAVATPIADAPLSTLAADESEWTVAE